MRLEAFIDKTKLGTEEELILKQKKYILYGNM